MSAHVLAASGGNSDRGVQSGWACGVVVDRADRLVVVVSPFGVVPRGLAGAWCEVDEGVGAVVGAETLSPVLDHRYANSKTRATATKIAAF